MFKWVQYPVEKLLWISKQVRRPMTFYTLTTLASFGLIWNILPDENGTFTVGRSVAIGCFCGVIVANCIMVYLWSKAKLAADPGSLSDTSARD